MEKRENTHQPLNKARRDLKRRPRERPGKPGVGKPKANPKKPRNKETIHEPAPATCQVPVPPTLWEAAEVALTGPPPAIQVPLFFSKTSDLEKFSAQMPWLGFNFGIGVHPRPKGEMVKAAAEVWIRQRAQGPLLYVGSPNRIARRGWTDWTQCPVTDTHQAQRIAGIGQGIQNWCVHDLGTCACHHAVAGYSLSDFHTLDRDGVTLFVNTRGPFYAVVPVLPGCRGTLVEGEKQFQMDPDGSVKVFKHLGGVKEFNFPFWLGARSHTFLELHMVWKPVLKLPDCCVIEFIASPVAVSPRSQTFDALLETDAVGVTVVDQNQLQSRVGIECSQTVFSIGSFLTIATTKQVLVTIPKLLVSKLRLHVLGLERSANNWYSIVGKAKRLCEDCHVPEQERHSVALFASAFAWIADLQTETDVVQGFVGQSTNFRRHAQVWKFNFLTTDSSAKFVAAAGLLVLGAFAKMYPGRVPTGMIKYTTALAAAVALLALRTHAVPFALAICKSLARLTQGWALMRQWWNGGVLSAKSLTSRYLLVRQGFELAHGLFHLDEPWCLPAYHSEATLESPAESARIKVSDILEKLRREQRPGSVLYGLGTTEALPTVAATTQANELIAVTNRGCKRVPAPQPLAWQEVGAFIHENWDVVFPGLNHVPFEPMPFEHWNSRFPLARQRKQREARKSLWGISLKRLSFRRILLRKSFIKREKIVKTVSDASKDYAPRLIQGATDESNSMIGPSMCKFSKELATCWSTAHMVCYSSGLTSEQVGRWFDDSKLHIESLPSQAALPPECLEIRAVELDAEKFDASFSAEARVVENTIYHRRGMGRRVLALLDRHQQTSGVTRNGVRYDVRGTRNSGEPMTSCGNSMTNGNGNLFILWRFLKARGYHFDGEQPVDDQPWRHLRWDRLPIRIIVLGDDMLMLCRRWILEPSVCPWEGQRALGSMVNQGGKLDWAAEWLRLGFVMKVQVRENLEFCTFCSARFCPSADGTILTPMLGRFISRFGWSVGPQKDPAMWLRGSTLGLANDVAHCPPLEQLTLRILDLTHGIDAPLIVDAFKSHCQHRHGSAPNFNDWMQSVYGVEEREVLEFVALVRQLKSLPAIVSCSFVTKVVDLDCPL